MKFAYIILCHKNAAQVARLIRRLYQPGDHFVIHISKTAEAGVNKELKKLLGNLENVSYCKREDGTLNGWGIVKAIINGISYLENKKIAYDYVHLLSGQDYPIKPIQNIKEYFQTHQGSEFLYALPMHPKSEDPAHLTLTTGAHLHTYRINRYHLTFSGKRQSIPELESERLIAHSLRNTLKIFLHTSPQLIREKRWREEFLLLVLSRLLPKKREIPHEYHLYGGRTWWSLTPHAAHTILHNYRKDHKLRTFYKYTLIPDEMYLQTILYNSALKTNIVNNDLREIVWAPTDGTHPITFTQADFDYLKASDKFFARKFDMALDTGIIDRIDKELL